jgi:hypothetical protein
MKKIFYLYGIMVCLFSPLSLWAEYPDLKEHEIAIYAGYANMAGLLYSGYTSQGSLTYSSDRLNGRFDVKYHIGYE